MGEMFVNLWYVITDTFFITKYDLPCLIITVVVVTVVVGLIIDTDHRAL